MICSKCGIEHDCNHRYCKKCHAEYQRQYRVNNLEKMRIYENKRNKLRSHPRILKSKEEKKNRVKEYCKKWYKVNRDVCLERCKNYRREHGDRYREYDREWAKKNIDRKNAVSARRRAKMSKDQLTEVQMKLINQIYKEALEKTKKTGVKYHVDHIVPLNKGGLHVPNNLHIILGRENLKKGVNIPKGSQLPLMY